MRGWRRLVPGSILPLFRKELVEMAARRRTYIIRFAYAAALFGLFLLYFHGEVMERVARGGPSAVLGQGGQMFEVLLAIQFIAIYALLPASMSMAITQEKERDSLSLLLLTGLRPWEILIEKYVSRLVPMLVFLLLSLPLMALCYALGGVDQNAIFSGCGSLVLACVQVGAIALFLSAFCSNTAAAFLGTYLVTLAVYLGPPLLMGIMAELDMIRRFYEEVAFILVPMFLLEQYDSVSPAAFLLHCIPALTSAALFLVLARVVLIRRAFNASGNAMVGFMKRLDRFWYGVNEWAAGGVILIKESNKMPGDDPVAWREITKRSLGKIQYLLRILIMMQIPVVIAGAFLMLDTRGGESELLAFALFVVWPIVALIVVTQGANLISSERVHRSLDILLTTPMKSRDILLQKVRAMRRVCLVLAVPPLTVYTFEFLVEHTKFKFEQLTVGVLAVLIYLPMLTWFGCWLGLRIKRRSRAVMAAVILLVIWCVGPVLLGALLAESRVLEMDEVPGSLLLMASPATMIVLADLGEMDGVWRRWEVGAIFVNFLVYGALAVFFRGLCLHRIDEHLGRVPEADGQAEPPPDVRGDMTGPEIIDSLAKGPHP